MKLSSAFHTQDHRQRAGMALFLVLVTFVLTVTTCVALARLAHRAHVTSLLDGWSNAADLLAGEAQRPIEAWLSEQAGAVVLHPTRRTPFTLLLDDAWEVEGVRYGLSVTAWDQNGMVPLQLAISGSALRSSLPAEVLLALATPVVLDLASPGLDLFDDLLGETRAFPTGASSSRHWFGPEGSGSPTDTRSSPDGAAPMHRRAALGAFVATHNPGTGRINVNTAPLPLLREVFRLSGRGGLDQIETARSDGRLTLMGGLGSAGDDPQSRTPQLVAQSDAWAFRVDARAGRIERSWWLVYHAQEERWHLVQRIPIPF